MESSIGKLLHVSVKRLYLYLFISVQCSGWCFCFGFFSIIAKGAGGGLGSRGFGSSRGALAVSVFELHKDEKIFVLVGQQGESACIKSFLHRDDDCDASTNGFKQSNSNSKTKQVKDIVIDEGSGGGGGGATFIFLLNSGTYLIHII